MTAPARFSTWLDARDGEQLDALEVLLAMRDALTANDRGSYAADVLLTFCDEEGEDAPTDYDCDALFRTLVLDENVCVEHARLVYLAACKVRDGYHVEPASSAAATVRPL